MSAESVNRQPLANNNQVRIVAVVALAVAVGLGLYFGLHRSSKGPAAHKTSAIGPVLYNAANLKKAARFYHAKFFWAGPQPGYGYEFTRNPLGYMFVRYLPSGVQVGAPGANFLIISTYPIAGAYQALKQKAKGRAITQPDGSIVFIDPQHRTSVYVAFPGVDQQVEVYDPKPTVALQTAESGNIALVP